MSNPLKSLAFSLKNHGKNLAANVLRHVWREALDREPTHALLQPYISYQKYPGPLFISALRTSQGKPMPSGFFVKAGNCQLTDDFVWTLEKRGDVRDLQVCRVGAILLNRKKLLNLDFGSVAGMAELPALRDSLQFPLVVAPWSHHWGSYFDFVICILGKLCRIEKALGPDIWEKAMVCYPLRNAAYEKQFLTKLGIRPDRLVDTRTQGPVQPEKLIVANNQEWNVKPSPDNIRLIRERFLPQAPTTPAPSRKIFLSRRGTRLLTNEPEVREVMLAHGFEIIEDVPRTVDEQIDLFRSAAVVVAPHGAALTNLLWCSPGTRVLELFHSGYTPPHYYFISVVLGFHYTAQINNPGHKNHYNYRSSDITVDIGELKRNISQILAPAETSQ